MYNEKAIAFGNWLNSRPLPTFEEWIENTYRPKFGSPDGIPDPMLRLKFNAYLKMRMDFQGAALLHRLETEGY